MRKNNKNSAQTGIALLELAMLLVIVLPLGLITFAVIDVLITQAKLDSLMQKELRESRIRAVHFELGGQALWGEINSEELTLKVNGQNDKIRNARKERALKKLGLSKATIDNAIYDLQILDFKIYPSTGANLDDSPDSVVKAIAEYGTDSIEGKLLTEELNAFIQAHLGDPNNVTNDSLDPLAIPTAIHGVLYQAEYGAINLLGGPMNDEGEDAKKVVTNGDARADYMPRSATFRCVAAIDMKDEFSGKILNAILPTDKPLIITNSRSMTGRIDF